MGINIRAKGAKAELEFCERFGMFFPVKLERNLLQTREGGSDITGCHPFVLEIKRVEDCSMSNKNSWWRQVSEAVTHPEIEIPCVGYRPSRSPWSFLVPWEHGGFCQITEEQWLKLVLSVLKK